MPPRPVGKDGVTACSAEPTVFNARPEGPVSVAVAAAATAEATAVDCLTAEGVRASMEERMTAAVAEAGWVMMADALASTELFAPARLSLASLSTTPFGPRSSGPVDTPSFSQSSRMAQRMRVRWRIGSPSQD